MVDDDRHLAAAHERLTGLRCHAPSLGRGKLRIQRPHPKLEFQTLLSASRKRHTGHDVRLHDRLQSLPALPLPVSSGFFPDRDDWRGRRRRNEARCRNHHRPTRWLLLSRLELTQATTAVLNHRCRRGRCVNPMLPPPSLSGQERICPKIAPPFLPNQGGCLRAGADLVPPKATPSSTPATAWKSCTRKSQTGLFFQRAIRSTRRRNVPSEKREAAGRFQAGRSRGAV